MTTDPWTQLARRDSASARTYRRRRLALLLIVSFALLLVAVVEAGDVGRSDADTPAVSRDPFSEAGR